MDDIKIHCPKCGSENFKAIRGLIKNYKLVELDGICEQCGFVSFPTVNTPDPRQAHAGDEREAKPL
jgi:uncharacterized Zn finger protein